MYENDTNDIAQLLIINPGITQSSEVGEKLPGLKSLHGTKTGKNFVLSMCETIRKLEPLRQNKRQWKQTGLQARLERNQV
jgi:hypothetical protein